MAPEQLIYNLWAKTNDYERKQPERRNEAVSVWWRHPLPLHLLDVGLVADVWLQEDQHLMERFAALWPEANPNDVRRALVLTAAAHDLGKAYPAFQSKSDIGWRAGYGSDWNGVRPIGKGFDHGAGTGRIFSTLAEVHDDFDELPDGIDPRWLTLRRLLHVGAGHHGTLYPDQLSFDDDLLAPTPLATVVPALLDELTFHFGSPPDLPGDPPPPFLLLAAGFVSVADWLGSNTDSFPPAPNIAGRDGAKVYLDRHRRNMTVQTALRKAGLFADYAVPKSFADLFSPPGERWEPREGFQAAACAVQFGQTEGPEIAVVEAPMGLGKTEIALYLAAQALRHRNSSGIYVALATQATSNALFRRVEQFGERLVGDENVALVLAHGAKNYFRDYRALREKAGRSFYDRARRAERGDPAPASEVVAPSWVQPSKRALLAPLGLGTIDQALLGAMGVKHGFVRLFGLARKVVILDEVHAYDVYMGALLEHLLAWLGALGAKVILLSATLPSRLRERLLTAYGAADPPASEAYPQLLHAVGDEPVTVLPDPAPETAKQTNVSVEPVEVEGDAEDRTAAGVAWVQARIEQGGCIAWIRNTVREAQVAADALRAAGIETDLLHARYVRADRNTKEEALLDQFGKPAPDNEKRPTRRVVVATQVIEQSVDVDFDAMLSDLAPIDLLLQRAGRLHRHERDGRRHGHDKPMLGVLMPDSEARHRLDFGNSTYVYDADTLARSAILALENPTWPLPAACRTLVAALYDRDETYWTPERLGVDTEALTNARDRLRKRRETMTRTALRNLLTAPDQFPVMRDPRNDRSDAGEFVALTTRYGAHTAAAVLFRETADGPLPLGGKAAINVPDEDDWKARLDVEEALAMASVSFPWYGPRPEDTAPPPPLAVLHTWWRDTHPYDDRLFLLLDDKGDFTTESVTGHYDVDLGLTVAPTPATPSAPESAPLEDL